MKTSEPMYKFLTLARTGGYSSYRWPEIGEWTPRIAERKPLKLCSTGYHVLTSDQILGSYMLPELYEIAWAGDIRRDHEKCAVRQAKLVRKIETWNDRTARIFAADCAERVLPLYEKQFPNETRVRACIAAARAFADGKITEKELDAARDAASAAARDAAWAARAAWAAASAAAWDATSAAASAAASAAERKWQIAHIKEMLGLYQ